MPVDHDRVGFTHLSMNAHQVFRRWVVAGRPNFHAFVKKEARNTRVPISELLRVCKKVYTHTSLQYMGACAESSANSQRAIHKRM